MSKIQHFHITNRYVRKYKAIVVFMKEHGVQIYPGGGKNHWVKSFCFMIFDFMKIVKQMVTLDEVMVA